MTIRNAKATLNGIDIQVATNGIRPRGITVVDEAQPWLSRTAIAAVRNDDDSLGFDVQMMSGARVRVKYGTEAQVAVPVNDAAALDSLYAKFMHVTYDLNGEGMAYAEALNFYEVFRNTQILWARLALIKTKLADPDIPATTRNALVAEYNAFSFSTVNMELIIYGTIYDVIFAEGQSCQFTDWVVSEHSDFQFTLVSRTLIEV